jgi:glutamate-1-semialdehyde aminotransferase
MTNKEFKKEMNASIPGGAHTYSKGHDQFSENAPAGISHGKGAWVWDVEGNKFLDCSMGLSSVSLGHAYEPVLDAVKDELDKGVNFQRPSYIELEMAKKFLSLVPKHQMVKFAKNGSTTTTAAIKLARAFTKRNLIAFPTDHPFFSYDDWFIGSTPCNKGVPEEFQKLSVTFKSCDIESLKEVFKKYPGQIAAVITEPEKPHCGVNCTCTRSVGDYLKEAIQLTKEAGAVFILDEMVTGFKTDLPGSLSKWDLDPDLATWGKGIANGFSFCALTGKKEIMELGGISREGEEKVFLISTTHGGETHALRAGIKTIEIFQEKNVIGHIRKIGEIISERSKKIIREKGLEKFVEVQGKDWIIGYAFKNKNGDADNYFRTLFLQEMIKGEVLFQGIFIPCFSHNETEVEFFLKAFGKSLDVYKEALDKGVDKYLVGEPTKPVFRKIL